MCFYTADYQGKFPPASWVNYGGQANMLRGEVFDTLLEAYGTAGEMWFCPNNVQAFRDAPWLDPFPRCNRGEGEDSLGIFDQVAIGYYYCGNLTPGYMTVGTTFEEVKSPATIYDPSSWVLVADYLALWWEPSLGQTYITHDARYVNHIRPTGAVFKTSAWATPEGSNVGKVDGSVRWENWPDLEPHQRSHPFYPTGVHFW